MGDLKDEPREKGNFRMIFETKIIFKKFLRVKGFWQIWEIILCLRLVKIYKVYFTSQTRKIGLG